MCSLSFLGKHSTLLSPVLVLLACGMSLYGQSESVQCAELASRLSAQDRSVSAEYVHAGSVPSLSGTRETSDKAVPEHCRVVLAARPTADSRIRVEIWLPTAQAWNGRLLGTGNGGYSSNLFLPQMADALRRGYAVAGSDTGHEGDSLDFGIGHPERIRDWAYRSTHVMAQTARQVVSAYYGSVPKRAYFVGCSTGGQQALSEAQRYPKDFDGIVAGDPGNDRIALNAMFLWSWLITHPSDAPPFPASKLSLVSDAVIKECGGQDGYSFDVVADPQSCHPNLSDLRCKAARASKDCLTEDELHQIEQLYEGPRDPKIGSQLFPGWPPGSEIGWKFYFVGRPEPARLEFWRQWIFQDPSWDPYSFAFKRDRDIARSKLPWVDATSPNLRKFRSRGGKLILYHGLADPVVPPEDSVEYYKSVQHALRASPSDFMRLFLVPGMFHCGGGPGATEFDPLEALDQWVRTGEAPEQITASHRIDGRIDRTQLLCPWPRRAVWSGKGDRNSAASFVCKVSSQE